MATQFLGALFLGLLVSNGLDGTFDLGIAALQNLLCLGTRLMDDLPMLGPDVVQAFVVVSNHLIEPPLLGTHVLSLVFPIAAVAHDVEQVFVHIDVVAAHNLGRLVNDLLRQARLTGNLDGERTAGIAHRQLEQRLHVLAVIEHRPVDHTVGLVGKMFQVLVVGRHHAHHLMLVQLLEDGLGDGPANLRFGATAHLVDEDERLLAATREEKFHVLQVAAVGTQVVLDALLVTDVDKDVIEQPHVGIVAQSGQQATLHHVLHHAHGLETHRLAAGIWARDDQDAVLLVQGDVQRHDLLALAAQREHQRRVDGRVPLHDGFAVDMAHLGAHILGKQGLSPDEVELAQSVKHAGQFPEMGTYQVGHLGEDADDFAGDFGLGLADTVIGLDNGVRLDEHGLSRGALVMDDAMQFALVHRTHRQHQAAIAQRGLHVIVEDAVLLALSDDAPQGAVDAAGDAGNGRAQFLQSGRCRVLDVAGLVEHMADCGAQFREGLHAACQFAQAGIRRALAALDGKEAHHLSHRRQQALQVKQALGRQECARC